MNALKWAGSVTLLGQLVTWAITIIVIRLLTPEDYGLMAIAMLFIGFLFLLNELGLGAVLVQKEDLSQENIRQIFALILVINAGFYLVLYLASPWIGEFFNDERLVSIVRVLALQFIVGVFEVIPVSLLEKHLDFKKKSLVYLSANIGGGITTLLFALLGHGVWSLVYGSLTIACLKTLGINLVSPYLHWPILSPRGLRSIVSFGGLVTLERSMWFFYTQADIFIVGKVLGKEALGVYSVAMHLASLIYHKTSGILYEVAFPSFSKIQDQPKKVASYLLKAIRIMSFILFPISFGISSIAPELVGVLLGDKWNTAGPILSMLAIILPLRMIINLLPPALQGIGRPDVSAFNLLIAVIVMPVAFFVGTKGGILGVSLAWVIVFPLVVLVMVARSGVLLGVTVKECLAAMSGPALLSSLMFAVVWGAKTIVVGDETSLSRLISLILIGAMIYTTLVFVLNRSRCSEVLQLLKR
jgi:teichuronic acid exporter